MPPPTTGNPQRPNAKTPDWAKHAVFYQMDAPAFADAVLHVLDLYDWEATCAQLNLLDSHDMARAQWIMGGNTTALRQAVLFLMTMPGAPCIYYGDEVGLSAAGDPHCREAFPQKEATWDTDLLSFYRDATALRHRHAVLRTGRVEWLAATGRLIAFRRTLGAGSAIVAFNAGSRSAPLPLPDDARKSSPLRPAWPPGAQQDGRLLNDTATPISLPARSARVWVSTDG